jgi:hypothetical protein
MPRWAHTNNSNRPKREYTGKRLAGCNDGQPHDHGAIRHDEPVPACPG